MKHKNTIFNISFISTLSMSCLILSPLIAIISLALIPNNDIWSHLITTVLPHQIFTTLQLMIGVGLLSTFIGIITAWFVTFYDFPAKRFLDWLLLLPLALPTYIAAYAYTDIFDSSNSFSHLCKRILGIDIWYPNLYNIGGAIFILSIILYPYIYLAARTSFLQQSKTLIEASKTLGANAYRCFWHIALPLARPSIIAGISLVLMECLNDIGAMEHLGVQTLTIGIYDTWVSRGSLTGAAQIALTSFTFIALLLLLERLNRAKYDHLQNKHTIPSSSYFVITGNKKYLITLLCSIPIILGFVLPTIILMIHALDFNIEINFITATKNSFILAGSTVATTLILGLFLNFHTQKHSIPNLRPLAQIASLGYALPGTILGLGILIYTFWLDKQFMRYLPESASSYLSWFLPGTFLILWLSYSIRFLSLSFSQIESGFSRIPLNINDAGRNLGNNTYRNLRRVQLPILRPTLFSAGIFVFVDAMKELPLILLLRPFNFETLATHIYNYASLGQIEEASLPALLIIISGLLPILISIKYQQATYPHK